MTKLFFLPGALGRSDFWRPVSELIAHPGERVHVSWPGFNGVPADPSIRDIDDLVKRLAEQIHQPSALIAQSMGGIVAILLALARPDLITHLVLSATSGGMDLASFGGEDWRPSVRADYPLLPNWFTSYDQDLTLRLAELDIPTLLLWGDADPISPVVVGQRLASLLPQSSLHVFEGGEHDLGCVFAGRIAPMIDRHLLA